MKQSEFAEIILSMRKIFLFCCCSVFAVPFLMQAQNIDSLIGVLDHQKLTNKEQISVYKKISAFYVDNELDKALEFSEKGLRLAKKENDKAMEAWFIGNIADCYDSWGKSDTALVYFQKSLELALETGDDDAKAIAYGSIGVFYFLRGKYLTALEYYMKGLSFSESAGNKRHSVAILSNIGGIHRSLMDNEHAVYYLEQARKLAEEVDSQYGMMGIYYDLGHISLEEKKPDQALEYMLKVVEFSHTLSDKQFEILGMQALAYIYCDGFKDYSKAEEYANESLQVAEDLGNKRFVYYAWIALSDVYFKQKSYRKCEAAAWKAWDIDSTDFDQGRSITQNIAFANALMGNETEALAFFQKYRDINKQYISKSLHEAIADLEVKYETEKKEIRISTLEKEKVFYIWLGIAGVSVLVLAFGILYLRHRSNMQKRKLAEQQHELAEQKVKQLEQEKQLIATQSLLKGETTERSRLARDLHDGLGGLLSVAKLNLMDVKIHPVDEQNVARFNKVVDILEESIDELRRVAHHMMPESLVNYGLRVSLEDFFRAIPVARFQYLGEDIRLDSRLEVMIYRCAHELVNNAVKYANASIINVQLLIDNGLISLTVQDNGVGFDPETVVSGSGLDNIRVRISAFNGQMQIISAPGKGTEICIEIE